MSIGLPERFDITLLGAPIKPPKFLLLKISSTDSPSTTGLSIMLASVIATNLSLSAGIILPAT